MAKMFYKLEEAAQTLGVSPDKVKELAKDGRLQQFRDRETLMFKREQVDGLVGKIESEQSDARPIELAEPGKGSGRKDDPRSLTSTGINVFETDEVDTADPMAQTQITKTPGKASDDSQLAVEGVGSGSGLLDLTRESDDTSLGAELLDEIYPAGGGEGSDSKQASGLNLNDGTAMGSAAGISATTGAGATGVLDSVLATESSAATDLSGLQAGSEATPIGMPVSIMAQETPDPAGSGLGLGLLIGTMAAMVILMIVVVGQLASGLPSSLVAQLGSSMGTLLGSAAILLVVGLLLGGIGFFIGRAKA